MSTADAAPPPSPDYLASLRLIRAHIGGSTTRLILSLILATLGVCAELAPIWLIYHLIVIAIEGGLNTGTILVHAAGAAVAIIVGFFAMGLALAQSHIVAFDMIHRLRLVLARHLARLPLGRVGSRSSGEAKTLVIDQPEALESIVAHGLPEGLSAVATWLAVSIWLFVVDWRMALTAIALTPIAFVLLVLAMTQGGLHASAFQTANERMNAAIVDFLGGISAVKIFNRTGEEFARTSETVRDYAEIQTRWARAYLPLGGAFYTLAAANVVVILPVGLLLMSRGQIDLSTLLLFVILGANYSQPLLKLFNQFHGLAQLSLGSTAIADLLNESPQVDTRHRCLLAHHDVTFEQVDFAYGDKKVLQGIDLVARTGSVTALVGPSGGGKTTLASLVARFHDVQAGRVTIGGFDVRDLGLDQLMETVSFVFQDTFLFSDTIAANIRMGRPNASDEQVAIAARAAQADDFIRALPDGYDTKLGAEGRTLSGGERQRLAIARAILKDAPVVVLDEATAFADPDNESAIQAALVALSEGRTLIMIAHRLHTIQYADQILVMDGGRIVERGDHSALLEADGHYARLWHDADRVHMPLLRPHSNPVSELT